MKLRARMFFTFSACFAAGMAVLFWVARNTLRSSFGELENTQVSASVEDVSIALNQQVAALGKTASDYAYWDRSYEFMQDPKAHDIRAEFKDAAMEGLGLSLVAYRSVDGREIYDKAFNLETRRPAEVPTKFLDALFSRSEMSLARQSVQPRDGLLLLPDGVYLVAVRPILDSDRRGEPRGLFIIGRKFENSSISQLSDVTRDSVRFEPFESPNSSGDFVQARKSLISDASAVSVIPLSESRIAGYTAVFDIFHNPLLILGVDAPRPIYEKGKLSQIYILSTILCGGAFSFIVIFIILQRYVLSRLDRLSSEVANIGARKAIGERTHLDGHDELSSLSASINKMLDDLENSQKQFRLVAENMHQVLWVKEARSRQYEYINEAFEKIFGRSRSSLDGDAESWKSSVVLSDQSLVEEMLRSQANGEPTEAHYRIRDESGGIRWLWDRSFPVFDMNGAQTQVIGLSEDITVFKQTEAALLDSQEKLEERVRERTAQLAEQAELVKILIDSAPVAMYVIDREGNITHCSRATTEMMGYASSDEVMGKNAHVLMHHSHDDGTPYPLTSCPIYACFKSGADQRVEGEVFWRKDGAPLPVEYHARQIHRADKVVGVIVSIFNVTQRREQEIELRHSQKLEAVGRLAAGIAHEINTPIQFVGDNTRFLKDSFYDELRLIQKYEELARAAASGPVPKALLDEVESQRQSTDWDYLQVEIPKAIEQMFEGLTRVSTIVRGMKEFSHVDRSSEKGPADINRALESTLIVARNELKYVADLETHFGELPTVICNLGDVNQVFLNLLINAAHAITDAVKGTNARGKIVVSSRLDGDFVEVSISDSGTGVPEEVRTKIFDPFFTTKEVGKGTGQGLALARAVIVDKHGGTITFDTKMGAGTTFFVRLPLVPANLREEVASR